MRAIVTGGAGFIGSHVVDALVARGDEVVVLDDLSNGKRENVSEGATLVVTDIRDDEAVGKAFADLRPARVLHLAAQADVRVSVSRPVFDAEVTSSERSGSSKRRASTSRASCSPRRARHLRRVRGAGDRGIRTRAALALRASKLAGEEYLATYNRLYGSGHTALRLGNVYGLARTRTVRRAWSPSSSGASRAARCRTSRDGTQQRDYVFVGDVAGRARGPGDPPAFSTSGPVWRPRPRPVRGLPESRGSRRRGDLRRAAAR